MFSCFTFSTTWCNISKSGYTLNDKTFAKETFMISRFFTESAKVYSRKTFYLVAFAKFFSHEKTRFWGRESFFSKKNKLIREPYKTIVFLGICVADSNINCQHVYSQYAPFGLVMIYRAHSQKIILVRKHCKRHSRKLISHISRFFQLAKVSSATASSFKVFKYFFHLIMSL